MLKSLKLTNFRKHTDTSIEFSDGLVVIRGENEAGKSTICEGILYAFFGSSTLRESLPEVVTYGQPENSLKAELVFEVDGTTAHITRGKSGAELRIGDRVVTGQNETKAAVERLLGCSAATASLLMFADQNAIRGVLAESGSAASSLVERLADLSVIENIVDAVQTQLPSGNTKAIDAQISTLKGQFTEVGEEPSDSEVELLNAKIFTICEEIEATKASRPAEQEAVKAKGAVEAKNRVQADLLRLQEESAQIARKLEQKPVAPFDFTELENARAVVAGSAEQQRRLKAFKTKFPTHESTWEGDSDSARRFLATEEGRVKLASTAIQQAKTDLAVKRTLRINEKSCAFCKKDLSDVPEVAQKNEEVDSAISVLQNAIKSLEISLKEAQENVKLVTEILQVTEKCEQLTGEYWALDYSTLPPKASWIGEAPVEGVLPDVDRMEAKWQKYQKEVAAHAALQERLDSIQFPEVPDTAEAEAILAADAKASQELRLLESRLSDTKFLLSDAKAAYQRLVQSRNVVIERNEANAKAIAQLEGTVKEMVKHNELIKQLRGARPEIAAKLWGTVLGAISHYFTQARGEHSVVTRDAKGFKVNGRNVQGLSGSTQDMLGLSIRMALSKLFLPGVPFLLLDESFAGCSDTRELNGVSTLASAGFTQVLLITHSELPGQLADKVINL